jgi:hypothetical protein
MKPVNKQKQRQENRKKRKNFLPTLLLTILLWISLFFLIYFVEPDTFGVVPLFFFLIFFAFLFSFATLLADSRRGLSISVFLTLFLILRYFGIGNILNLLLLLGLFITSEVYFLKNKSS